MADNAVVSQRATITDFLGDISQGRFVEEGTKALSGLVKEMNRVAEIGGGKPKGRLVITINLMMDRGIMEVDPSIKVTTPATPRGRTIMYPTPDGRLTKNDNRQGALDLDTARDVSTTGSPIRSIAPRDGRAAAANDV